MTHRGPRWLSAFIAMGAILTMAPAGAGTRTRATDIARYQYYDFAGDIADASSRYGVPERLVWAVIRVESGFDHRAVSRRGARGLMQLMPQTAAKLRVRNAFDPRENIDAGTRHLSAMLMRFRYDVRLAVAAYNAGERPVLLYGGVPPFPETREYVDQVMYHYNGTSERRIGKEIRRVVRSDGTILYTNVPSLNER